PLDKLAIIADKVSEVVGSSSTICAATTVPPPSQSSSCSAQPTMDSRQADPELSLQVAELTRGAIPLATNDIVLTAGDHIHALEVSIEEVASATIIAVIKSRPAIVFHLVHLCKKRVKALS
ncbi:hypothetical protein TNCV_736191, partial [Trichonephila clavipes]